MPKSLQPLWRAWKAAYYRWALSEIEPTHPDVPYLVMQLSTLEPTTNG